MITKIKNMSKIALITGATSGIGAASAELFAAQGYNIIITGRRGERLNDLSTRLQSSHGIQVKALCLDVRDRQAVQTTLSALPEEWKLVDVLINNAGLSAGLEPLQDGNIDDWEVMIDTNIKGLLYVTKEVSNWMIARRSGHIINLGSIAAKETYKNGNVYCATKHAVDSLNQAMRIDMLPYGIRVSAIHPGAVETEFSQVRFKGDTDKAAQVYQGYEPLRAEDIADAIWFLASRPDHVNINDLVIMPKAQASTSYWHKDI